MKNKKKLLVIAMILVCGISILTACTQNKETKKTTTKTIQEVTTILPKSISTNYNKDIASILEQAIPIKEENFTEAIDLTKQDNYNLDEAIKILGNPHYILDTYNGKDFYVYDETLINKKLKSISKDKKYKKDSYVKIGWISEKDEILSTYIPLDLENQITGYILEDKNSEDIALMKKIKTTDKSIKDIINIDITIDELNTLLGEDLYCYKTQYPMSYESKFIQSRMDNTSTELTSQDFYINTKEGYLHVQTFESVITNVYQIYNNEDEFPIVKSDILQKVTETTNMTQEEFLNLIPEAKKVEILRSSFNNTVSTISCYAIIDEKNKMNKDNLTTIKIADGMVINENIKKDNKDIEETKITDETENKIETTTKNETDSTKIETIKN